MEKFSHGVKEVTKSLFYISICAISIVCAVCVITSVISFKNSQKEQKEDFAQACASLSVVNVDNLSANKDESTTENKGEKSAADKVTDEKDFETTEAGENEIVGDNGSKSTEGSETGAEGDKGANSKEDNTDKPIDYLERLIKIQKEASTNNMMSLIYGAIGAVLTAVGAAFVAYIFKCKEMASEAENKAQETISTIANIKDDLKKAQEDIKIAKEISNEAVSNADFAKNSANESAQNAKLAEQAYKKQLGYQECLLDTQNIYIKIAYAKIALANRRQTEASDRFSELASNTLNFIEKIKGQFDSDEVKEILDNLYKELCLLADDISEFEEYTDTLDEKDEKEKKKKISSRAAIENYTTWLNEAISHCEEILK